MQPLGASGILISILPVATDFSSCGGFDSRGGVSFSGTASGSVANFNSTFCRLAVALKFHFRRVARFQRRNLFLQAKAIFYRFAVEGNDSVAWENSRLRRGAVGIDLSDNDAAFFCVRFVAGRFGVGGWIAFGF